MKQLAIFLLLLPFFGYSQKTFAPLGAVWNYEMKSEFVPSTNGCSGNHIRYRVVDELIVHGKDCSLIRTGNSFGFDSLIVFQDQDKIYFLQDTAFLLLFDFGAQLGDTIIIYDPVGRGLFSGFLSPRSDTTLIQFEMVVTDVTTRLVAGEDRRVLTFESTSPIMGVFIRHFKVMDGIGCVNEGFSGFFINTVASGCDGYFACYRNDSLYYQARIDNNIHPGCEIVDTVDDDFDTEIEIYPNPFVSEIHIDTDLSNYQVRLLDGNGRVVMQGDNATLLKTEQLDSGVYVLQMIIDEKIYNRKTIKI